MRSKRLRFRYFVFLSLAVLLTALTACDGQEQDQFEEEASALATNVERATQTASSPSTPEPDGEDATEEPSEKAMPDIDLSSLEEYVSVTEFFHLRVPAGWSAEETFPGGAFIMANSDTALERHKSGSPMEPSDLILNIGFLPYALFRQREVVPLNIQFDATPNIFLQSLLPMFQVADDAVISDPELVSLNAEMDAGLVTVSGRGREGLILMFNAGDEVVVLVSAVGYPGELEAFQEAIYAVAAEVTFSGPQDELYGMFLGG